jgi:hypothetical protein
LEASSYTELCAAMPEAGGQYVYINKAGELAQRKLEPACELTDTPATADRCSTRSAERKVTSIFETPIK